MTARDRRAIMVGVACLLTAVVLLRLLPAAVHKLDALETRTVEQTNRLWRARETVLTAGALNDSLQGVLEELVDLAPRLVTTGSPAEAGAALTGVLTLAAQRAGLRVAELTPIADSAGTVFGIVEVRARLEGDINGLARFLAQVESGEMVLSVNEIAVSAGEATRSRRSPEVLRIELNISGLFLREDYG